MKLKYCKWEGDGGKIFIERLSFIYGLLLLLIVLQNVIFTYLLAHIEQVTFKSFTTLIFINNSVANFILFISFYLLFYWLIPVIRENCSEGILKKEVNLVSNHKILLVLGAVLLMVVISILRLVYYRVGTFDIDKSIEILTVLFRYPHPYFEIGGYMLGSLSVTVNGRKKMIVLHTLSYLLLLMGAYFEAKLAFS